MKNHKMIFLFVLLAATDLFAQEIEFNSSEGDFKGLFNSHRVAQPRNIPWAGSFFPYSDKGTAVKLDRHGQIDPKGQSPMSTYGKIMGIGKDAHEWEAEVHSCEKLDKASKKSCQAWWGHCNGWAAAAIKEAEPKKEISLKGQNLSVADQKGILTELWLASYSINAGETDKGTKAGRWVHDHKTGANNFSYTSFWDVSPKAFFLALTNQIGAMKTGFVIDRFTGDEVWNQPIVGYRIMPILPSDVKVVKDRGESYWAVKLGVKFYWANDLGTSAGHVSAPFDIFKMTKDERGIENLSGELEYLTADYEGRYLEFSLHFDDEVVVSHDGKKILKAGELIGEGTWEHQEHSRKYTLDSLNHSHPDFMWLPTNPYQDLQNGYGNPFLEAGISEMIEGQRVIPAEVKKVERTFIFKTRSFTASEVNAVSVKRAIKKILLRDSIRSLIRDEDVTINGSEVTVKVIFYDAGILAGLPELFAAGDLPFKYKP